MPRELFAGLAVSAFDSALRWYESLLGTPPSSFPHATEAVWELAESRYLYIVQKPDRAGHGLVMLFVEDLDVYVGHIAARGLEPVKDETYDGGVRKVTFRDQDGNEVSFGGMPAES